MAIFVVARLFCSNPPLAIVFFSSSSSARHFPFGRLSPVQFGSPTIRHWRNQIDP